MATSAMARDPMKKLVVKSLPGRPEHRVPQGRRFRGRHLFILLVIALVAFVAYKKYFRQFVGAPERMVFSPASPGAEIPPLQPTPASQKQDASEKFEIRHQLVHSGESMVQILDRFEISRDYMREWEKACKPAPFARIHEGDELIFFLGRPERNLLRVFYSSSGGPVYAMRKTPDGWECLSQESSARVPVNTVVCRYAENFYDSCIAGGLPASLIANLADIFSYDIDFNAELKDGDSFIVYFQEQEIEGKEGKQYLILAAEMVVAGKVFQAFGFQHPDEGWEYFDPKGLSLKRSFLKSPLSCRRMLSPSSYKNVKPVLKMYRPHLWIDYAAPRGTPVSAIGDGVVTVLDRKSKSTLSIEIRHRGGFKSVYGNLSGYSRGLNRGSIVSQGEVIGSVGAGASGKAFLNFHLLRNGKPVNFQSSDFHRAVSIPKNLQSEFEKTRDSYLSALKFSQRFDMPSDRE